MDEKEFASNYNMLYEGGCSFHCLSKRAQGAGKGTFFHSCYSHTDAGKQETAQRK